MTAVTQIVRDQAFLPIACDIPEEMTLAQYRASRVRRPRRRLRAPRLRRR